MLITQTLGNLSELPDSERSAVTIDPVRLGNLELVKRVQRVTTASGREIGLRLPTELRELRDGDVLHREGDEVITVEVLPSDVLVIRPASIHEMGVIAHGLGNRHLQAQFFDADSEYGQAVMVVQYDHTVEHFLEHQAALYSREDRVLPHPFRHAEHTH
ncbi:urease accessory protein UreE [uncultured Brachybacterium sp.]|uniref:urease accessory protein UreE n=1 Tax=uncultured Brachybacterium sp. TaxID=189680 RepID=UPI002610D4EF|nr:urease accessory protein UreE [uncultured Brachybacterium sp.]